MICKLSEVQGCYNDDRPYLVCTDEYKFLMAPITEEEINLTEGRFKNYGVFSSKHYIQIVQDMINDQGYKFSNVLNILGRLDFYWSIKAQSDAAFYLRMRVYFKSKEDLLMFRMQM